MEEFTNSPFSVLSQQLTPDNIETIASGLDWEDPGIISELTGLAKRFSAPRRKRRRLFENRMRQLGATDALLLEESRETVGNLIEEVTFLIALAIKLNARLQLSTEKKGVPSFPNRETNDKSLH